MESSTGSRDIRKTVIVGVIGNIMEWYDFALYGYFAPVLASDGDDDGSDDGGDGDCGGGRW